ncbi:VC0807 family protein [Pseudonocardia oroxyli]|uniref:Uncharacterized protein n=1 Tax=Pseudonocardia oroxyli TaxID=366584 RepID=A0A1G7JEY8_PSEOR|nr:VC0807 family protein [Pseudonocardia oroxyli]SDF23488.1 hypothetical protein SAMN05216377_10433 [Pseudonocardia oroxyli]
MFLGSLLLRRPLMFCFGRKFGTDGSAEGIARWNSFWDDLSVFRHGQRVMTVVWGLAFVVEALVRIPLVYALSVSVGVVLADVLPFVVIAGLVTMGPTAGLGSFVITAAVTTSVAATGGGR